MGMSENLHLFQVAHATCEPGWEVDAGYEVLHPTAADQGWGEYGPISRFLRGNPLDEGSHYGFFVPGFTLRTGHTLEDVHELARGAGADVDALLFSEYSHNVALFRNVFERGEFFVPGLMRWARVWLQALGSEVDPQELVMGVEQMVLSNCLAARPRFWRRWLELSASLRRVVESPSGSGDPCSENCRVELMRCVAPYMLSCEAGWRARTADPFAHGRYPLAWMREDPTDLVVAAALKHAMRTSGWRQFGEGYLMLRREILDRRPTP